MKLTQKSKLWGAVLAGTAVSIYCAGPSVLNYLNQPPQIQPMYIHGEITRVENYDNKFFYLYFKNKNGQEHQLEMFHNNVAMDKLGNVVCGNDFEQGHRPFGVITPEHQEPYKPGLKTECGAFSLSKQENAFLKTRSVYKK